MNKERAESTIEDAPPAGDDVRNWYVLLTGVPGPDVPTQIADGLTIRRIEDPLTVFDLAAAGAAGFREWAVLEPIASVANSEIETAADAMTTPGYDALNRAWLASALLVLRGYQRLTAPACSAYSWNRIAGHQARSMGGRASLGAGRPQELPRFSGGLLDYHLKTIAVGESRQDPVSVDDAEWLMQHFETFNRLASDSESFRFALEASVDWRYSRDLRTALARVWAGIEAVFGISSELVYRISILSAALLEQRGATRRERYKEVKKLYSARSKAVHGGTIKREDLVHALDGSVALLGQLLLLTTERGHILVNDDFENALFD